MNSDSDELELPTEADIRAVRVNYFTRNVDKPVRFRHSIGSPSLLLGTHQECSFRDEEVDRFFETYPPCDNVTSKEVVPTKTEIDKSSVNLFLKDVLDRLDVSKKNVPKYVIVQRDIYRFWNVLMRQKFDLVDHDNSVRRSIAGVFHADNKALSRYTCINFSESW